MFVPQILLLWYSILSTGDGWFPGFPHSEANQRRGRAGRTGPGAYDPQSIRGWESWRFLWDGWIFWGGIGYRRCMPMVPAETLGTLWYIWVPWFHCGRKGNVRKVHVLKHESHTKMLAALHRERLCLRNAHHDHSRDSTSRAQHIVELPVKPMIVRQHRMKMTLTN